MIDNFEIMAHLLTIEDMLKSIGKITTDDVNRYIAYNRGEIRRQIKNKGE